MPASEHEIRHFEKLIGERLPSAYREFLLGENGGRPERISLVFETEDGVSESVVNYLYTLNDDSAYSLAEKTEVFEDRIPSTMIPIASDPFGNQFLMKLGDERGAIYFWDHELENEEGDQDSNVYLIANSFSEFAKMFP